MTAADVMKRKQCFYLFILFIQPLETQLASESYDLSHKLDTHTHAGFNDTILCAQTL